jgi:hypothetical protein
MICWGMGTDTDPSGFFFLVVTFSRLLASASLARWALLRDRNNLGIQILRYQMR